MSPQPNHKGFTLVELIVVMAIFIVVIILAGDSFNMVLTQASKLFRSEESSIEGVVGLEMFRYDLGQAGFGLASEVSSVGWSGEAAAGQSLALNDPFTGAPPRPIAALERSASGCAATTSETPDSQGYLLQACSDYLALKGTTLGTAAASKRWTFLNISSVGTYPNTWSATANNPQANDSVIVLSGVLTSSSKAMTLQPDTANNKFYFTYAANGFTAFDGTSYSLLNVYGVGSGTLRMPFNRADYFVATPPSSATQAASRCASGTGILYKAAVGHSDGLLTYMPLMDCVAGMQIVLGWDTDGDGMIDTWSNADGSVASGTGTAATIQSALSSPASADSPNLSAVNTGLSIRSGLKMVKIYILAQNGRKDTGYTSPSPITIGEDDETALTYSLDVAAKGWSNYRWKLYRVVVVPKNLPVNQ